MERGTNKNLCDCVEREVEEGGEPEKAGQQLPYSMNSEHSSYICLLETSLASFDKPLHEQKAPSCVPIAFTGHEEELCCPSKTPPPHRLALYSDVNITAYPNFHRNWEYF